MIGGNNTLSTKRMTESSNKETYPGLYHLTGLNCYLERMDYQIALMLDEQNAYQMYKAYIDYSQDIAVGDLVIDASGNEYTVKGVQKFENNLDTGDITQLLLVKIYRKNA